MSKDRFMLFATAVVVLFLIAAFLSMWQKPKVEVVSIKSQPSKVPQPVSTGEATPSAFRSYLSKAN